MVWTGFLRVFTQHSIIYLLVHLWIHSANSCIRMLPYFSIASRVSSPMPSLVRSSRNYYVKFTVKWDHLHIDTSTPANDANIFLEKLCAPGLVTNVCHVILALLNLQIWIKDPTQSGWKTQFPIIILRFAATIPHKPRDSSPQDFFQIQNNPLNENPCKNRYPELRKTQRNLVGSFLSFGCLLDFKHNDVPKIDFCPTIRTCAVHFIECSNRSPDRSIKTLVTEHMA
jgi:hypothetical protein